MSVRLLTLSFFVVASLAACSSRSTTAGGGGAPAEVLLGPASGGSAGSSSMPPGSAGAGGSLQSSGSGGSSGGDSNGGSVSGGATSEGGALPDSPGGSAGAEDGGRGAGGGGAGAPAEIIEEEEITFENVEPVTGCETGTPGCDCASVSFTVGTRASCDMQIDPESTPDGVGSVAVDGVDHTVFAMNRWGAGHVIAWCDSDSAIQLMDAFPGWAYLAQAEAPRIAMIGSHWGCELMASYPFWGNEVPAQYIDDPAQLAADWDVIMLCGFHMGLSAGEGADLSDPELGWPAGLDPLLRSFVKDYGKGLFVVMEYYGTVVKDADLTHINSIVRDAGFSFLPTELPWGDAQANVALECVPDVPIIR